MATSTTTRKKKRRPKLAPRYIHSGNPSNEENAEEKDAVNAQQSKLSFSEANFHKSLKFGIWSTTTLHNALLDQVFKSDLTACVRHQALQWGGSDDVGRADRLAIPALGETQVRRVLPRRVAAGQRRAELRVHGGQDEQHAYEKVDHILS
ncbi:hypothetical protein ON010_g14220 [Phytophthora cinnamomi]|nr:hypothetical protein ON010_g14220 [Phytophthora cinnamomi]